MKKSSIALTSEAIKKKVGYYAAGLVETGMTIGLGTGTTAYWLTRELGDRARQGLELCVVPTSAATAKLAVDLGLTVMELDEAGRLVMTIDGADEIDPEGQLIKGGGGALLQEKIVADASEELIIIADHSKLVDQLGHFPLPVEVVPFGSKHVERRIMASGHCRKINLRQAGGKPFLTDHHHYLLDCHFEKIENAGELDRWLHDIPGVVETGLFINWALRAIIGYPDGKIDELSYRR